MFQDLDTVLKNILIDPAAPDELRNADVRTETPDRNFTARCAASAALEKRAWPVLLR